MRKSGWVLLLGVLLLSGCAVRLVYNQLDWLVPWYLDDYIELEGPQKPFFRERLDAYLVWHRQQQLPLYADFLEQVADRAGQGMSREDIAWVQARTEQLAQAMIDRLKPDMMALFALATDEQVEALFRKFAQDNARYRRDRVEVTEAEQRRATQKDVIRYAERWTGTLSRSQRKLIANWSARFELMDEDIYQTQLRWQEEFHRILRLRQERVVYEQAFAALLDTPDFGRSEAMQQKLARNQVQLIDLYLALEHSLSPRQRQHMVDRLRDYAGDFRALSTQ